MILQLKKKKDYPQVATCDMQNTLLALKMKKRSCAFAFFKYKKLQSSSSMKTISKLYASTIISLYFIQFLFGGAGAHPVTLTGHLWICAQGRSLNAPGLCGSRPCRPPALHGGRSSICGAASPALLGPRRRLKQTKLALPSTGHRKQKAFSITMKCDQMKITSVRGHEISRY